MKKHKKSKKWKRSGKFNRHHIKNKVMRGTSVESNILIMDTERHSAWHFLFKNKSFKQVAELLLRVDRIKKGGEY